MRCRVESCEFQDSIPAADRSSSTKDPPKNKRSRGRGTSGETTRLDVNHHLR